MRNLILIFVFGIVSAFFFKTQSQSLPKWIRGGWHNSFESDSRNFVFWTFLEDSIFYSKGFPISKQSLDKQYSRYKRTIVSEKNLCRITFSKMKDTAVYEFKLQKVDYWEKPVMTYSLEINGRKVKEHSASPIFMKGK